MKHQYFADINDYRKYGLIRALITPGGLSVGVCWMLTPGDGRTDGKFTAYARDAQRWRAFDPLLFDALALCHNGRARHVGQSKAMDLIPGGDYFDPIVPDAQPIRREYFSLAFRKFAGRDLIFLDPDNGLEVPSVPKGRKNSSKYLFWDELTEFYSSGGSVLVYQHFPRRERRTFTTSIARTLSHRTSAAQVYSFSSANVVFLLAVQLRHVSKIEAGVSLLSNRWADQFGVEQHSPD